MPTIKPRCTITFDDEQLRERIDEFRFNNRYRSQNDAIMALINRGIEVLTGVKVQKREVKLSPEDKRLLNAFHNAKPIIQDAVMTILEQAAKEEAEDNLVQI